MLQDAIDFLHYALSINLHGLVRDIAQSNVVHRAILSEIDGLSIEHLIAKPFHTSFRGKGYEKRKGLVRQKILREIEEDLGAIGCVAEYPSELLET